LTEYNYTAHEHPADHPGSDWRNCGFHINMARLFFHVWTSDRLTWGKCFFN